MKSMGNVPEAKERILQEIRRLLQDIQSLSSSAPLSIEEGIAILREIRVRSAEDINQLQHEALLLEARSYLEEHARVSDAEWFWNSRQTGTLDEPDLRAVQDGAVILSAEATAAERPVGTIDTHMRKTLGKLRFAPRRRFYFVRTSGMLQRAQTKLARSGFGEIDVIRL